MIKLLICSLLVFYFLRAKYIALWKPYKILLIYFIQAGVFCSFVSLVSQDSILQKELNDLNFNSYRRCKAHVAFSSSKRVASNVHHLYKTHFDNWTLSIISDGLNTQPMYRFTVLYHNHKYEIAVSLNTHAITFKTRDVLKEQACTE
jgi:hypothetical protein